MNEEDKKRLIADLEAIAASIRDPAHRQEVLKIIARFSDEWPDDDELLRIRSRYSTMPE
jgi:hypothetical protein